MYIYHPPEPHKDSFHCPFCGVFARQYWSPAFDNCKRSGLSQNEHISIAQCEHCSKKSLWVSENMVYPGSGNAPLPNQHLPDDIKDDYEEARSIAMKSPRGAAALLRLCIQKLCKSLGESGENINQDIKSLIGKGLPVRIQQALDIVRVIGNESVHPGQINLNDNREAANALFKLVNLIADDRISQPQEIDRIYNSLPSDKLAGIQKRDQDKQ